MTDLIQNEWNVQWYEFWTDIMSCLKCYFCTPCLACWNLEELDKSKSLACYLGCCFMTPAVAMARTQTREKYGIEGEEMNDWCLSCFCPGCSEFQVAAELKKRKESGEP